MQTEIKSVMIIDCMLAPGVLVKVFSVQHLNWLLLCYLPSVLPLMCGGLGCYALSPASTSATPLRA